MKLPELRRRIRALFQTLRERGAVEPPNDDWCTVSAGELATFISELLGKEAAPDDDDAAQRQVAKALVDLLGLIETGELVRDLRQDHGEGWTRRMVAFVTVLKHAIDATETAREKGWIG